MVRHYDMASCEIILDPHAAAYGAPVEVAPQGTAIALRLQTVQEAIALEQLAQTHLPADLLAANPAAFIDAQK